MVPRADHLKLDLTIVMGCHGVGKTNWCNQYHVLHPNSFHMSFDSLLWTFQKNYSIDLETQAYIADSIFCLMFSVLSEKGTAEIVIDGFPTHLYTLKRFLDCADKSRIVYLTHNHVALSLRNLKRRKTGQPFVKEYLTHFYEMQGFVQSQAFKDALKEFNTQFLPLHLNQHLTKVKKDECIIECKNE